MSLQAKCQMVFAHMQFNKYFLNICMQKYSAEVQSMDFLGANLRAAIC